MLLQAIVQLHLNNTPVEFIKGIEHYINPV